VSGLPASPGGAPSRESLLVALSCRVRTRAVAQSVLETLAREVDSIGLWDTMERHQLVALVGTRLQAAGLLPEDLDPRVDERLQEDRLRALLFAGIGDQVLRSLEAAGIRALALKGYALAENVHGDAGLRRYGDIDVLVSPPDLERAVTTLAGLGYERESTPIPEPPEDLHHVLVNPTGAVPEVELHWRVHWFENRFSPRMLRRSEMAGDRRRAAADDELAALLLFYARDGFQGLRLAADLAAWWDTRSGELGSRPLDHLAEEHPELRATWWAALQVAERVVGIPATRVMTPPPPGLRRRLAVELANWQGTGDPDQLSSDVLLVNLLLAPRGEVGAALRRSVFLPRPTIEAYYGLRRDATLARTWWRMAHPPKMLVRFAAGFLRAAMARVPWRA
jgi:hypothetical protein